MAKYSKNDIIRIVDEEDIEFIRLQFTDIFGTLKNVAITASQLEKALDNKCMFDGSSIEGFVRIEESDMYLHPDLDTFMIFPWRPQQGKVARIICDVYMADGTPFEGDPRYILKKQIEKAKQMGYIFNVGPECEFFLFHLDENGQPTTISHERAGYFDLGPNDLGENARRDMVLTLEDMDFEIEASHHEVAPAQHEIDFKYEEALHTADNIMTFKLAIKTIAKRHGLFASFMPKPKHGVSGSGMHINMSLSKDGVNIFDNEEDKLGLSKEAYYFIGGIMKHMKESDMYLHPDLDTFMIFPWRPQQGKVARIICDVYMADGTPFEGDPRYILKKQIEKAKQMGYIFNVGPECEFFLFHLDENGQPTTISHERAGYFDLGPNDLGENARRDMVLTLEDMDFEIEASHHEVAPAQHEIDFKYEEALHTADNIMTFKLAIKTIAKRHGLFASFMPKPKHGVSGSGMHINMSLSKDGVNIFDNEEDKLGLSKEAYYFIGGIMKHMKGMTVITNPIVNSYKRFVPGYEAPIYITWSATNRSPLIRIPAARGEGRRVELRNPDPSANPYLVLALCLAAGIDGIKNKVQPDAELRENVFELTEQDKKRLGIESLPADLHEAVECLKSDDFIREILGEHIYNKYIEAKEAEWNDYRAAVTQWEIDEYLYKF